MQLLLILTGYPVYAPGFFLLSERFLNHLVFPFLTLTLLENGYFRNELCALN